MALQSGDEFVGVAAFLDGFGSGEGGDAADTACDGFFGDDAAEADLSGIGEVCAAAEFDAEVSHGDDAHFIGIFFAEECHCAAFAGVFDWEQFCVDCSAAGDAVVDDVFDLMNFGRSESLSVSEVKSQFILLDTRTPLSGGFANGAVECVMEDVCSGVSAADTGAAFGVNLSRDEESFAEVAFEEVSDVNPQIAIFLSVDDVEFDTVGGEGSGVSDLAAGFGVEGAAVESDADWLSVSDFGKVRYEFTTGDDSQYAAVSVEAVIAEEAGTSLFFE